jgi:hypothetical protein
MESGCSCETIVLAYQGTRCHTPEERSISESYNLEERCRTWVDHRNRLAVMGYIDTHEKRLCITMHVRTNSTSQIEYIYIFLHFSITAICNKIGICHVRIPRYPNMRRCDIAIFMSRVVTSSEAAHSPTLYERMRNSLPNLVEL